jgi:hypothetical protein
MDILESGRDRMFSESILGKIDKNALTLNQHSFILTGDIFGGIWMPAHVNSITIQLQPSPWQYALVTL